MGRLSERLAYSQFRQTVEAMPKQRMRLRARFVPELTAWLQLIDRGLARGIEGAKNLTNNDPNSPAAKYIAWAELARQVIGWIGQRTTQPFNRHEWNEVVQEIAQVFGIKDGDPAPGRGPAEEDDPTPLEG